MFPRHWNSFIWMPQQKPIKQKFWFFSLVFKKVPPALFKIYGSDLWTDSTMSKKAHQQLKPTVRSEVIWCQRLDLGQIWRWIINAYYTWGEVKNVKASFFNLRVLFTEWISYFLFLKCCNFLWFFLFPFPDSYILNSCANQGMKYDLGWVSLKGLTWFPWDKSRDSKKTLIKFFHRFM